MKTFLKLLFIALLPFNFAFGAEVQWSKRLEGSSTNNPLINGREFFVTDGDFSSLGSGAFVDAKHFSYVRLGLAEHSGSSYFAGKIDVTVVVDITPYSNTGVIGTPTTQTLTAQYIGDGSTNVSIDADDFRMQGGVYMFMVKITSLTLTFTPTAGAPSPLTTVPNFVYLEGGISAERYYNFNAALPAPSVGINNISFAGSGAETVTTNTTTTAVNTDELELTWAYISGAEYYDVEWVWVDNYSAVLGTPLATTAVGLTEAEFTHNSTRIRTTQQNYRIPQVFAKGYLIYRVRAVGRWSDATDKDKYGPWSSGTGSKTFVSHWPNSYTIGHEHEQLKNWQYQTTYAEDGRRKDVTQYFDGSLRGRQTVTRMTSSNQSIVGETIYDNEGRGVIQVLPVPQDNPAVKFYPNLNQNASNIPYSHKDFDWEVPSSSCVVDDAGPMNTAVTGGHYYSTAAHAGDQDWQQYVPDAEGYGFTQVEYTPDNTGRIRNQSGVGATHKIGGGKETYYYYLQPSQQELNRLFGYKVGYKQRYKKNMVVDANGQVSVSYLDAQGRVIATALSGNELTPFDPLASETDTEHHLEVTTDLLNKATITDTDTPLDDNIPFSTGQFGAVNDGLRVSTQIGVVDNMLYTFTYVADFSSYTENCGETGVNFPYVYDLTLSLKDDCGNERFTDVYTNLSAASLPGAIAHYEKINPSTLDRGSYTLYKEIKVSESSLEAYKAQYLNIATNPCILGPLDFVITPVENCVETTCASCMTDLGTEAEYTAQFLGLGYTAGQLADMYDAEVAACDQLCAAATTCDAVYAMLLNDVSPEGQYGTTSGTDPMSVYTTSGSSLPSNYNWRNPYLTGDYLNEDGTIALIEVQLVSPGVYNPPLFTTTPAPVLTQAGSNVYTVKPEQLLNLADFVDVFDPNWAKALVQFHPEYQLYEHQEKLCVDKLTVGSKQYSSDEYDDFLNRFVTTYAEAQTNATGVNFTTAIDQIKLTDPFFNNSFSTVASFGSQNYNTVKNNLLTEAFGTSPGFKGTSMTLFQYAVKTAIYGNNWGNPTLPTTWAACLTTPYSFTTTQMDAIWQTYKSTYLSFKSTIKQLLLDVHGFKKSYGGSKMYNIAIGNSGIDFGSITTFSYSTANYGTIVSDVVGYWGSTLVDFPRAFEGSAYDTKTARFVRIDNLYDAGLPDNVIIAETEATADYNSWLSTGLCPLTLDIERLLDGMGKRGLLKVSTNNPDLPELVPDLFTAITGSFPSTTSTMNVSGAISGTNLILSFAGTSPTGTYSITIPQIDAGLPWSSYASGGTPWYIFSVTSSYPISATQVQVLIKAGGTLAGAQEYVVTYTSNSINLNACQSTYAASNQLEGDCDKEEQLESSLLSMLQRLHVANQLNGTAVSLNSLAGFTYSPIFTDHFGATATWTGGSTATIVGANGNSFKLNFTIPSATSPNVLYTSLSIVGTSVYAQYTTLGSPAIVDQTAAWSYRNSGGTPIPLLLDCGCDQSNQYSDNFEEHLNYIIALPTFTTPHIPAGSFFIGRQLAINSGITFDETAGYTIGAGAFNSSFLQLDMNLAAGGTNVALDFTVSPGTYSVNDVAYFSDVNFGFQATTGYFVYNGTLNQWVYNPTGNDASFTGTAVMLDGTIGTVSGRVFGFYGKQVVVPCDDCLPQPQAPISCNQAYTAYSAAMIAKFGTGLSGLDLDAFNEDYLVAESNFCENAYAYISTAYISYINNAQISSLFDEDYLSISEFGATPLGFSNTNLSAAVTSFFGTYLPSTPHPRLTWNDYVDQVFLPLNSEMACPPIAPHVSMPLVPVIDPCLEVNNLNLVNSMVQYNTYLDQMGDAFTQAYIEGAMSTLQEQLTEKHVSKEYHYTLYYYDRAGNLIQTVPPQGVNRFEYDATNAPMGTEPTHAAINAARTTNTSSGVVADMPTAPAPDHILETEYRYNSLNQLVYQRTPDGGVSKFAYDRLGRLVMSQNEKQANLSPERFSYTRYDALGRVLEAGEMSVATNLDINARGLMIDAGGVENGVTANVNAVNYPDNISTIRYEVTRSIYDELKYVNGTLTDLTTPVVGGTATIVSLFGSDYALTNTRNRIVAVLYQATYNADLNASYDNGTFYDYDVHGNVKHMIQINRDADLTALNHHIKHVHYDFDLVSGKVNKVYYQKGRVDQFIHRYRYDADNRITNVETSKDDVFFEKDAKYFYYEHGPLARTEIGDDKVQAQDYAYTIQGWLKTVNGEQINSATMMGKEGELATINTFVGKDAYGYSLSYFAGDYKASTTAMTMLNFSEHAAIGSQLGNNIYNGNIRAMHTAISDENEAVAGHSGNGALPRYTHQTVYKYDQLNRIVAMNGYKAITPGGSFAASGYKSQYGYDANGNITILKNWTADNTTGNEVPLDDFAYKYLKADDTEYDPLTAPTPSNATNRLGHVDDAISAVITGAGDLKDQNPLSDWDTGYNSNYKYDKIGQLIEDAAENISLIEWTVTNKVKKVTYLAGSTYSSIEFTYDAMGHRIAKKAIANNGDIIKTFYVLDAQGTPMSLYAWNSNENKLYLSERNLYGSSRIGVEEVNQELQMDPLLDYLPLKPVLLTPLSDQCATTGMWYYDVTATTSTISDINADNYDDVKFTNTNAASNPYSTQVVMNVVPGQTYTLTYDYLAKTNVNSMTCYVYDCGVGTLLQTASSGGTLGTKTVTFTIPTNGSTHAKIKWGITKTVTASSTDFTISKIAVNGLGLEFEATRTPSYAQNKVGDKRYELSNHLGNVLNVITDRKIPIPVGVSPGQTISAYTANVISYTDYYAFGQVLPNRNGNTSEYRFGYQGSEKDDEVKGNNNSYTTYFRQLDPRIGRWFSIDPKTRPWESPYVSMGNNPIWFNDPLGDDPVKDLAKKLNKQAKAIGKHFKQIAKESDRLSKKEKKEAYSYAKKHGGTVDYWKDSHGNDRYSLQTTVYVFEGDDPDATVVVTVKTFLKKEWADLRNERKSANKEFKEYNKAFGEFMDAVYTSTDGVPDAIGVSVGGEVSFVGSRSLSGGFVIFTRGPDQGFHWTATSGEAGVGLSLGGGLSIYQGNHYGDEKDMKSDYGGTGYQVSGKVVLGGSVSGSHDEKGYPTWFGGSASIGPAVGSSTQKTYTFIK